MHPLGENEVSHDVLRRERPRQPYRDDGVGPVTAQHRVGGLARPPAYARAADQEPLAVILTHRQRVAPQRSALPDIQTAEERPNL